MKNEYFNTLSKIAIEFDRLLEGDREKAKILLYKAYEITQEFNKAKHEGGRKDLDLDERDLFKLMKSIKVIWEIANKKNLEVWPKPDITIKIG